MENKEHQIVNRAIRNHIRFMTRMEKAFYSAIVLTAIVMSIAVVFLQGVIRLSSNKSQTLIARLVMKKQSLTMLSRRLMS